MCFHFRLALAIFEVLLWGGSLALIGEHSNICSVLRLKFLMSSGRRSYLDSFLTLSIAGTFNGSTFVFGQYFCGTYKLLIAFGGGRQTFTTFQWPLTPLTSGTFQMIIVPSTLPLTMYLPHGLNLHEIMLAACTVPAHSKIAVWKSHSCLEYYQSQRVHEWSMCQIQVLDHIHFTYFYNLISTSRHKYFARLVDRQTIDARFCARIDLSHQTAVVHLPVADFAIGAGGQDLYGAREKLGARKLCAQRQHVLPSQAPENCWSRRKKVIHFTRFCMSNGDGRRRPPPSDAAKVNQLYADHLRHVPNYAGSIARR